MKKRICVVLLAAVLLLLIPVSLLVGGSLLPSFYSDSYYAQLPKMYERLYTTEGKKLVLLGGSNLAFGVDTALLEQTLREQGLAYTVCPFGLYGAVGTGAMLSLAEDALGEGDIVVLAIEPDSDAFSTYFGATAFWKCCEEAPQMLLHVNNAQSAALVGNYIPYLQERWSIFRGGSEPVSSGVYAAASFDESCNMIYERTGNTMALGYDTAAPVDLAQVTISSDFAQQVNAFCADAAGKGASVYLSFSPVNRSAVTEEAGADAFFTLCNETLNCPIISDPGNYILDSGWFYDSNFHLNTAGAQVRTMLLAEDILAQLGCYQMPNWAMPEIPESIAQVVENDAQVQFFRFSPMGSGWIITGLTEEGMAESKLTVPSAAEGKPVVGFAANALENAVHLTELTLPSTIESLPDGFFGDCIRLERLVLQHTGSLCSITEHTFDGADQVRIFVPEESYHLYRDGDGCEVNTWSEFLSRIFTY